MFIHYKILIYNNLKCFIYVTGNENEIIPSYKRNNRSEILTN
jgi:hypothetical protein